jgi:DNA helicase-2/ATP-dependent DNA helicase PcrA
LWFAAVHANEIKWPEFNFILADEVQDFNEAQKIVLKKLHEAGAKIVAVGDLNQSIYRFRGADSEAFGNIEKQLTDLSHDKEVTHSLTKNYRSRPAIIDFVNRETHVKNLTGKSQEEFPDGDPGIAERGGMNYNDTFATLNAEKEQGNIKQTAFIARTNEPLVHAALKLLGDGVPFVILGKDLAKELMKHIRKIMAMTKLHDDLPASELSNSLSGYHEEEKERHSGASSRKAYLQGLNDTTSALVAAIQQFSFVNGGTPDQTNGTIGQFKEWLKSKLGGLEVEENARDLAVYKEKMEKEKPVVLTTAHKSKGLEFSRVFILRDDQFPHPRATRPEDLSQEANARYVAMTRARDSLHILALKGQPGYKDEK